MEVLNDLKKAVRQNIGELFNWMDASDLCSFQDKITDMVCDDVIETSNYPNYNDSDIRIAISRTILNLK